eukprot:CAMPEP_0194300872 /NCGR_PEP_ID=MMETSP0169-20130528/61497_1 /TAXON_ID=218684 /ORGANISM="Corethron pennatum, Strain L29A3" /LENGTH=448 /DNA_ID=CAMNT_0039051089 /DNA_START=44 /DNA_END=1390 /DNA_ORIENTATION=-
MKGVQLDGIKPVFQYRSCNDKSNSSGKKLQLRKQTIGSPERKKSDYRDGLNENSRKESETADQEEIKVGFNLEREFIGPSFSMEFPSDNNLQRKSDSSFSMRQLGCSFKNISFFHNSESAYNHLISGFSTSDDDESLTSQSAISDSSSSKATRISSIIETFTEKVEGPTDHSSSCYYIVSQSEGDGSDSFHSEAGGPFQHNDDDANEADAVMARTVGLHKISDYNSIKQDNENVDLRFDELLNLFAAFKSSLNQTLTENRNSEEDSDRQQQQVNTPPSILSTVLVHTPDTSIEHKFKQEKYFCQMQLADFRQIKEDAMELPGVPLDYKMSGGSEAGRSKERVEFMENTDRLKESREKGTPDVKYSDYIFKSTSQEEFLFSFENTSSCTSGDSEAGRSKEGDELMENINRLKEAIEKGTPDVKYSDFIFKSTSQEEFLFSFENTSSCTN